MLTTKGVGGTGDGRGNNVRRALRRVKCVNLELGLTVATVELVDGIVSLLKTT